MAPHTTLIEPLATAGQQDREIRFNYTSADDRQAVALLLGREMVQILEELRHRRVTGRSARLLARCLGELLVHRRNPYLFQEMVDSTTRRRRFAANIERDLGIIAGNAAGDPRVAKVVAACRNLLKEFLERVAATPGLRRRLKRDLGAVVGTRNVLFDPFTLVAHATDATDWRLHLPLAVVLPDEEAQVAPLLKAIERMGLKVIPRGGGTGLTGGAVPLHPDCVMVNTEKLNRIRGIREQVFTGREERPRCWSWRPESSPRRPWTTRRRAGWCSRRTPPAPGLRPSAATSPRMPVGRRRCAGAPASTTSCPGGWPCRAASVGRCAGVDHQLRKILPDDTVTFEVAGRGGRVLKRIELRGDEIRKKGLWKDITNKALGGLPGLQKEGTDGIITSAEFLLYPGYEMTTDALPGVLRPRHGRGQPRHPGTVQGVSVSRRRTQVTLLALEHFDDEYVRAIDYKVKAPRAETPKAVLLIDVAGHAETEVVARHRHGSGPSWSGIPTPCSSRRGMPPRPSATGRTARSWAPLPGAPTPSS